MFHSRNDEPASVSNLAQTEQKNCATYKSTVEQAWRDPKFGSSAARAICIISSSPLAAQYLVLLLQSCSELNPMLAEAFFPCSDEFPNPIFVLDCACLSLPPSECLRRLHKRFGNAKYIVIDGIQTENDAVSRVALGIHGMVEQRDVGSGLEAAVRAVAKDRLYISEGVLEAYVRFSAKPKRNRSSIGISSTTPRETEILELVKRRLSNKEIALTLGVQESTVKFHLGNILGKLQLQSRYDLSQGTREAWEAMLA
jgi:DNA-binding NarL/FixJ family response regulator